MNVRDKDTTKTMDVIKTELKIAFIISVSFATHRSKSFSGQSNSSPSQDSNHALPTELPCNL